MTLYTDEIKQMLSELARTHTLPRGLVFDVVEYEHHLALRLYRDNFETFDGVDKQQIANKIGDIILRIRQKGVPCYMEVEKSVPRA